MSEKTVAVAPIAANSQAGIVLDNSFPFPYEVAEAKGVNNGGGTLKIIAAEKTVHVKPGAPFSLALVVGPFGSNARALLIFTDATQLNAGELDIILVGKPRPQMPPGDAFA